MCLHVYVCCKVLFVACSYLSSCIFFHIEIDKLLGKEKKIDRERERDLYSWALLYSKAIKNEWEEIKTRSCFIVGNGRRGLSSGKTCGARIKLWKKLSQFLFLFLFLFFAVNKDGWVAEGGEKGRERSRWSPCFSRQDNDGVLGDVDNLFRKLQPLVVRREVEDTLSWRESNNANFSIISLYCSYSRGPRDPFPISIV